MTIDALDRKILALVQENNLQTHQAIGDQVGLSASAVRKRLAGLRKSGIIAGDVALLRPDPTQVQVIVTIVFQDASTQAHAQFEALIRETPEIMQAYHVSGGEDYIILLHCPSLDWYEKWSLTALVANPLIGAFNSRVVWSRKKYSTAQPLSM